MGYQTWALASSPLCAPVFLFWKKTLPFLSLGDFSKQTPEFFWSLRRNHKSYVTSSPRPMAFERGAPRRRKWRGGSRILGQSRKNFKKNKKKNLAALNSGWENKKLEEL